MYTEYWWGNVKDREHLEDLGVDGMAILKLIINKYFEGRRLYCCVSEMTYDVFI